MSSLQNSILKISNPIGTVESFIQNAIAKGLVYSVNRTVFGIADGDIHQLVIDVADENVLVLASAVLFNEVSLGFTFVEDGNRNGGTSLARPAFNLNRDLPNPPPFDSAIFENPVSFALGTTLIDVTLFGSAGQGNSRGAGTSESSDTFLWLKRNTSYLLGYKNTSGSIMDITITLDLAEATSFGL